MNPTNLPRLRYVTLAMLLLLASFPLLAASPTGSIVGTVLDSSGASVAGAKVIVLPEIHDLADDVVSRGSRRASRRPGSIA